MNLIELVTRYKEANPESKLNQQLYAIPQKETDMIADQLVYYYGVDRYQIALDSTAEFGFKLNWLKMKSMTALEYKDIQDSYTNMETLISEEKIYPFLLFANGRMIRWEYIYISILQERYELIVQGMNTVTFSEYFKGQISDIQVVMLPDGIEYKDGGFDIGDTTMFAFDEYGLCVESGEARTVIDNYDDTVSIISVNPTAGVFTFTDDNSYEYFAENICLFTDGLYTVDDTLSVLSNTAMILQNQIDSDASYHVRVFHNKNTDPSYSNICNVVYSAIESNVHATIAEISSYDYLEYLKSKLNVDLDPDKDYDTNLTEALDTIASHNHRLFKDYYSDTAGFEITEVDYEWFMDHVNEDGFFAIPSRFDTGYDYYILLLVNGELFKYYVNHYYENGWFYCPITSIVDGDQIEIWYFKNAENHELEGSISSNQAYEPLDTDTYYDDDTRIFSTYTPDTTFDFDDSGLQHFSVDFTMETDPDDETLMRVRFTDESYYDKDIVVTSANRFKYLGFNLSEDYLSEQTEISETIAAMSDIPTSFSASSIVNTVDTESNLTTLTTSHIIEGLCTTYDFVSVLALYDETTDLYDVVLSSDAAYPGVSGDLGSTGESDIISALTTTVNVTYADMDEFATAIGTTNYTPFTLAWSTLTDVLTAGNGHLYNVYHTAKYLGAYEANSKVTDNGDGTYTKRVMSSVTTDIILAYEDYVGVLMEDDDNIFTISNVVDGIETSYTITIHDGVVFSETSIDEYLSSAVLLASNDISIATLSETVDEEEEETVAESTANVFKLNLGSTFMYCDQYDRFLIFYNGRRVMDDHFRLVLPTRSTTPFTVFELYMCIPLQVDDRIDVFYLPFVFSDIDGVSDNLSTTGIISLNKSEIQFPLDNELFTVWLNGKKVPPSALANMDSERLQVIEDQGTLQTLRVTSMVTDEQVSEELYNRFQNMSSNWDLAIQNTNPYTLLGITVPVLSDTEDDFFADVVDTDIIVREIIRDHYVSNGIVDISNPFIYDYLDVDSTAVSGEDSAGNVILDVADSNTENNLEIERPWP